PPPPPPPSCGDGCGAASNSYPTAASTNYPTSGNVARDDNITAFAGSYEGNESDDREMPKHTNLPELSVPDKYTTYEEFAHFLSQANSDDFSTYDKENGISASTSLRRSTGYRGYREEERRRRNERRRREESRCTNRRLRNMIEEV
ncbi:hypothetical protein PMAYCL1PPCAC_30054, partial [Pristionchus mayeri]